MRRVFFGGLAALALFAFLAGCQANKKSVQGEAGAGVEARFHDFVVTDIAGETYNLGDLKGKKVMVVNVASKCGLTPQYEGLEVLYRKYSSKDFVIIGFPANNFMGQEPGTDEEILDFCTTNFDVTFQMMSKVSVKGEDQHPLYTWLTQKTWNGVQDSDVRWNFQKYLIDESGKLVGIAWPRERPDADKIISWIEEGVAPGF